MERFNSYSIRTNSNCANEIRSRVGMKEFWKRESLLQEERTKRGRENIFKILSISFHVS